MIIRATKWTYEQILDSPDELVTNLFHIWNASDKYDKAKSGNRGSE